MSEVKYRRDPRTRGRGDPSEAGQEPLLVDAPQGGAGSSLRRRPGRRLLLRPRPGDAAPRARHPARRRSPISFCPSTSIPDFLAGVGFADDATVLLGGDRGWSAPTSRRVHREAARARSGRGRSARQRAGRRDMQAPTDRARRESRARSRSYSCRFSEPSRGSEGRLGGPRDGIQRKSNPVSDSFAKSRARRGKAARYRQRTGIGT